MTSKKVKDVLTETVVATRESVGKPLVDLFLGRTMSRKLQVLILATWLVYIDKITGDSWMFIALLYVLGILWLNHVQSMAKLGKSFTGKDSGGKFGGSGSNDSHLSDSDVPPEPTGDDRT